MKLPINFTVSVGLVENFVSSNSYRPLDIIRSRKGLTVEIGNTDAEGRLVLADCMNWTQEMYKVKNMVELSTLTGAIVIALGRKHAGLFSNSNQLCSDLIGAGEEVEEQLWRMPLDEYHH
jgi:leucyl aminopeptidase